MEESCMESVGGSSECPGGGYGDSRAQPCAEGEVADTGNSSVDCVREDGDGDRSEVLPGPLKTPPQDESHFEGGGTLLHQKQCPGNTRTPQENDSNWKEGLPTDQRPTENGATHMGSNSETSSRTSTEVEGHTGTQRTVSPSSTGEEEEDVLFDGKMVTQPSDISEGVAMGSHVTESSPPQDEKALGPITTDSGLVCSEMLSSELLNDPTGAEEKEENGHCDGSSDSSRHGDDRNCHGNECIGREAGLGTGEEVVTKETNTGVLDTSSSSLCDPLERIKLLETKNAELNAQLAAKEASFQEVTKELESKCFHQQERIEEMELEEKKTMEKCQQQEKELLLKIEQVTKQSEAANVDKANIIEKLAVLQAEQRNLIDQVTDKDKRVKEMTKEIEKLEVLVKKQRAEVLKLQASLEKAETRSSQLAQDLTKEKAEVNSLNIKIKWAQNKLKTETEAHRTTKSQLEVMGKKLKESQEEGGQIRADMKQMIQQYQESEEMRSNSLDIKLKKTEKELKQQEQEIADQQDLHELTVKELDLVKASHKIAQEEVQHHKQKLSEMNGRVTELIAEIEELKCASAKQKQENKKLAADFSELEQRTQGFEKERVKFSQLREVFTQLQKSNQHLEKELEKRKEREAELLAFSAKLSSSNAELTAERSDWEAKVASLSSERDAMTANLSECKDAQAQLKEELRVMQETSQAEVAGLLSKLDGKTKAVEQLSMSLEDERELVKAVKKKNTNVIKDLQKQLQSSKRRIESLEASISCEREPPATLPISRASSHSSLDGVIGQSTTPFPPVANSRHHTQDTPLPLTTVSENTVAPATISLSDEERIGRSPSPEYKFSTMDQEKIMLVEKLCQLKKELMKQEEKADFFEEHIAQLTEEIQGKSRIIQNFIMREQAGALAPPSFDANKLRQAQKGGVMGTVFSGKNSRAYKVPEVNYELSLEMNKKMQSVLEDTLLKNITLKENIDTLGKEIQRISAQLQTYEKLKR